MLSFRFIVAVCCLSGAAFFCCWTLREGGAGGITPVKRAAKEPKALRGWPLAASFAYGEAINPGTDGVGHPACRNTRSQMGDLPSGKVALVHQALSLLGNVGDAERQTTLQLVRFIVTGRLDEIGSLDRRDVASLLNGMGDDLQGEDVALVLEAFLGIPKGITLAQNDLVKSLLGLFDAIKPSAEPAPPAATLVFTDHCEDDGTITGSVHVIPAGTKRVYAVFENAGSLRELDYVLAVWRDPKNRQMVFSECEQLRRETRFNYVYLELADGWLPGNYRLDLCHPACEFEILTNGTFSVN